MNPSASSRARWKVSELQSIIHEENANNHVLPFLAITETWLKSYISDAQLHIPGCVVSRSDRDSRIGGGVLLYSHANIPVSKSHAFDDGICEAIFCRFDAIKTCVVVVYRPPNASLESFSSLLGFISAFIQEVNDDSYDFNILGDFNLPVIDWETGSCSSGGVSDTVQSANLLLNFISHHFLNQFVLCPTRGGNVLDLFMTNNARLVTNVQSRNTEMSDHDIVDIMLCYNPLGIEDSSVPIFDENSFRSLDFNRADFGALKQKLIEIAWENLRSLCSFEEFPALFTDTLFQLCTSFVPLKKVPTGRPKHHNALRRKKVRLKARLNALIANQGEPSHIRNVQNSLALVHYDIKEIYHKEKDRREQNAVERIKTNPKFFYSFAKSLSKVKASISMLYNDSGDLVTDRKAMADVLQEQFTSVFSDPNSPHVKEPEFEITPVTKPLENEDFNISDEDILKAISRIPSDAAPGPDGIPVSLLKNCAAELCEPIELIWVDSFNTGTVPQFYKETHVSPLYKKENRAQAVSYRPVALT
ncbi:MAG: hypothetical protein GY774_36275, partial [Planctomycetes bacterium]|nr:hypothetical protein [Planctomycetota bacterium]